MTRNLVRACVTAVAICLVGLATSVAAQGSREDDLGSAKLRITWAEFKKLYDAGKAVVIDVRGDESYRAGHIPGAQSIPYDQIEGRATDLKKLKTPIVLYCA